MDTIQTRRNMIARRLNVHVSLDDLFAERTVVLVRVVRDCGDPLFMSMSDIGDFLKEKIRGPARFSCKTGQGCKFEEPEMNKLILEIFGDEYITLKCHGGECLHYSQVPGYVVSGRVSHIFV